MVPTYDSAQKLRSGELVQAVVRLEEDRAGEELISPMTIGQGLHVLQVHLDIWEQDRLPENAFDATFDSIMELPTEFPELPGVFIRYEETLAPEEEQASENGLLYKRVVRMRLHYYRE